MASLSSLFTTLPTTTSSRPPSFSKSACTSPRFKVSCNASSPDDQKDPKLTLLENVDRRNMLLGLGGLYGAANLTNIGSALAYPITAPDDVSHCVNVNVRNPVRGVACCPPASATAPKPYHLPQFSKLRIRPAAHRLTPDYVSNYKAAIAAMKALPDGHPHSWTQQAKVHCAYCNGAYSQEMNGRPDLKLQVHNSSIFFPFHRWYLYFHERILGKLIKDPTFALPYWNWDNPTGMMLPAICEEPGSDGDPRSNPTFDPYRNVKHLPPTIVDLQFNGTAESGLNCVDQMSTNLSTMYGQMVNSAKTTDAFFGTDPNPEIASKAGSIEGSVHNVVHDWVGNPRMPHGEDMGTFYSAGYDPVFYFHHSNVDRMWKIWKDLNPRRHKDPTSYDWLNASFVFYDENEELVRVYNKDCVDTRKMGYNYEPSRIPWVNSRPVPRIRASNVAARSFGDVKKAEKIEFPLKLDQIAKVLVKRPATKRSDEEKAAATEVLFLNGIKYNGERFFKLDVLVNDVDDGIETTAASSEFAGTFAQVPHNPGHEMFMTSGAQFGITELLEDIEAEDDEYVLVTLIPKAGAEGATVDEIKIELVPIG
ncbi:hypothetical protein SSX86_032842 [Deinandra increscens subsp. villosa]|uniref:Tyrosinase copper-binding domain-containing protein n=1 Tax=Deinandra increscens subsp. villosa TaxID=3103831 RepID=A0AAP0GHC6_9ASTR